MAAKNAVLRVVLLLASLPMSYAAAVELPESFRAADAHLKVRLLCSSNWTREYAVSSGALVFRDSGWVESGGAPEIQVKIPPDQLGRILEKVFTSSFPYLPARVGDDFYFADGDEVTRLRVAVRSQCEAELSFAVPEYSKTVSYGDLSLFPTGLLDDLQRLSGESGDEED